MQKATAMRTVHGGRVLCLSHPQGEAEEEGFTPSETPETPRTQRVAIAALWVCDNTCGWSVEPLSSEMVLDSATDTWYRGPGTDALTTLWLPGQVSAPGSSLSQRADY